LQDHFRLAEDTSRERVLAFAAQYWSVCWMNIRLVHAGMVRAFEVRFDFSDS